MLTIYHLDRSRSERIVWLCEEIDLPYRLVPFERGPDLLAPALKQIHALGRAPVIDDDGTVLAESGAIVEFLLARYGDGRLSVAPDQPGFAPYLYWLHYAEGSLMLQLLREATVDRMMPTADQHPGMARLRANTRTHLEMIEATLGGSPYLAGPDFTAADQMMLFPFTTLRQFRPLDLSPFPAISAWVDRLTARPAYVRASAAG